MKLGEHELSPLAQDVVAALGRLDVDRLMAWQAYEREDAAHKATKALLAAETKRANEAETLLKSASARTEAPAEPSTQEGRRPWTDAAFRAIYERLLLDTNSMIDELSRAWDKAREECDERNERTCELFLGILGDLRLAIALASAKGKRT